MEHLWQTGTVALFFCLFSFLCYILDWWFRLVSSPAASGVENGGWDKVREWEYNVRYGCRLDVHWAMKVAWLYVYTNVMGQRAARLSSYASSSLSSSGWLFRLLHVCLSSSRLGSGSGREEEMSREDVVQQAL